MGTLMNEQGIYFIIQYKNYININKKNTITNYNSNQLVPLGDCDKISNEH